MYIFHLFIGTNGALYAPYGGLHITPHNLSKFMLMMIYKGTNEKGERILSENAVKTMITPQWVFDGNNGTGEGGHLIKSYGLGIHITEETR